MYKDWLESLAANRELKWTDLRVLLILLANISSDTTAEVAQTEITRQLGIKPPNVSRSLKKLRDLGIISKKERGGKLVGYQFRIEGEN